MGEGLGGVEGGTGWGRGWEEWGGGGGEGGWGKRYRARKKHLINKRKTSRWKTKQIKSCVSTSTYTQTHAESCSHSAFLASHGVQCENSYCHLQLSCQVRAKEETHTQSDIYLVLLICSVELPSLAHLQLFIVCSIKG